MMTPLKMWCLLPLAVLLLLSITPTEAEVMQSMSECKGFLLKEIPPNIPGVLEHGNIQIPDRYKVICQTYENVRRFLTLYDTENKIPVFSGYKYRGGEEGRPEDGWKIEPQLEDMTNGKNMENCERAEYEHQASDKDYTGGGYDRGHLFPSSHAFDENDKKSTFTLTNIVPQASSFNQGSWRKMEEHVKKILENNCNKEGYVVTGAQPSKNKNLENKQINIPSVLWSAFCCNSKENKKKWIAGAHWGDNVPDNSADKHLQIRTLEELQKQFRISVFPGTKCPLKETVDKLDPKIKPSQPLKKPAPPTTTNQQQFIDFLYGSRKFNNICKSDLRGSVKYKGPQAKNLWDLCLKLNKQQLKSEHINEDLKKVLLKLLNE
uniref:Endonuclease domain-containing 1 protein-like n=2 Tax=Anabas testudineus TaxID=64144 RepID=A0A7N6BQD8_ANATE